MIQAERYLHQEICLRLSMVSLNAIVVPVPNGVYIPTISPSERSVAARLISRMKQEGQMLPGAADLLVLWQDGSGAIELKRPAEQTLLGKRTAGRPTAEQKEFAARCADKGVRHTYATSWGEVHQALTDWGRLA